jgi:hypothetical protein
MTDRGDADRGEPRLGGWAHAPHQGHGQLVKELEFSFWSDDDQSIWFRDLRRDHRLQELELICDAVAVVILHRLDMDSSALIRGIEKISDGNRERLGTARNEADSPTVAQRREFARALAAKAEVRSDK